MKTNRSEKGQAFILIIVAIVALFGFAALAVDGGNVYAERRRAQNAVDASALAAASAKLQGKDWRQAAISLAGANGYTNGGVTTVTVHNPPISGPYKDDQFKEQYYQVIIQTKVDPIFAHFVFSGEEKLTVEAVTRVTPTDSVSPGNALHATGINVCPGVSFSGSGNTYIEGGNIYSNSTAKDPTGNCVSGKADGSSGNIQVKDGDLILSGTWIQNAGLSVSPAPKPNKSPIDISERTPPVCTGLPARTFNSSSPTLQPGVYSGDISINNGTYEMKPGLYCLKGNLTVNGGTLTGSNLAIYMMPTGGGISIGGNAFVNLATGPSILDGAGVNQTGYLVFMDVNNKNGVDLSGSSGSIYQGTIYAPGPRDPQSKPKCNIGGNTSSLTLRANIICYTIGLNGGPSLNIIYNPEENRRDPASLSQAQ